jgi:hypothetical protein
MTYCYRNDLTAKLVRSLLDYNPETGIFYWRIDRSTKVRAGDRHYGYIRIKINGVPYQAHRLAWLFATGEWPKEEVDHINLVRNDNRFCNLREATHAENRVNRPPREKLLGLPRGVRIRPNGKFEACIAGIHLGTFDKVEEAADAYVIAAQNLYGDFYREAEGT